jgi:hypothetical protein
MSAKATYAKPPINLPELPPELWIVILTFATEVPEVLDESPSLFQFPGEVRNILKNKKSYRSSLVSFIQVSSFWSLLLTLSMIL